MHTNETLDDDHRKGQLQRKGCKTIMDGRSLCYAAYRGHALDSTFIQKEGLGTNEPAKRICEPRPK